MRTLRTLVAPRMLGLHAAGMLVVTATILLGLWQFGVWHAHRSQSAQELANAAPKPITEVLSDPTVYPNTAVGVPVTATGSWLPDDVFYVSGRQERGVQGYWMVVPLGCGPSGSACTTPATLVVLGFTTDPSGVAPRGEATVTGWLQPSDSQFLADPNPNDDILPTLRIPSVAQRVNVALEPGYVVAKTIDPAPTVKLTPVSPEGLPKPPATSGLRNLLYGMQWWIFGGFALFMWWRWSADAVLAARSAGAPQDPSEPAVPSGA